MNSLQKRELYTAETGQKTLNLKIAVQTFRFEFVLFNKTKFSLAPRLLFFSFI